MTTRMTAHDDERLILFPPESGEALARLETFVPSAGGRCKC